MICRIRAHYARTYTRSLRDFHGRHRRDRARRRPSCHRLRQQRLPADEHAARGARDRAHRGLWRRAARSRARCGRRRQCHDARSTRRSRRCSTAAFPMHRVRSGSRARCCATVGCSPWPARTARPPPPRCSPGSSSTRDSSPGFLIGGVPANFGDQRAAGRSALLRHRGGRVRHRLLRQAGEVRSLPSAHADPQ